MENSYQISVKINVLILIISGILLPAVIADSSDDFIPAVTASCKAGFMTIRINFQQPYNGAVHARDHRIASCMATGNGSHVLQYTINLLAQKDAPDYCGVSFNNKTEERSIQIAVRVHNTLELAEDKVYVISCGKAGFTNAKNETSLVGLRFIENNKQIREAIYGRPYTLRAELSKPDDTHGIVVKSCFAFNKKNKHVPLIDDRGCPMESSGISQFVYDKSTGIADAELKSMFKFHDSSSVHFQCDVAICKGACDPVDCSVADRFAVPDKKNSSEGLVLAATSIFVLEPGQIPTVGELCDGSIHPQWLLWLCIALGILFLVMLLINIFLCSAMTCSCARTEIIEKEPSVIEEYDPYRSWHGSQYDSRYSLHGGQGGGKGYTSGGSTIHSTRSASSNSDHYAIVHSRPGSRYSGGQQNDRHGGSRTPRGPPSHM